MIVDCQAYLMGKCYRDSIPNTPVGKLPKCKFTGVGPEVKSDRRELYLSCRVDSIDVQGRASSGLVETVLV